MTHSFKPPTLRLPKTLAATALHCAIAGTLACSGSVEHDGPTSEDAAMDAPQDASADASQDGSQDSAAQDAIEDAVSDVVVYDSLPMCDSGEPIFCGPMSPDAGNCNVYVCDSNCPQGCEPFV
jgi:hypothetical protein